MTRAEQLAELTQRFEDWVWDCPAADLMPREEEILAGCRRASVRLEEVLAGQFLDETLALALQKGFCVKAVFVELFSRRYEDRLLRWLSALDHDEHRRRDVVQMLYMKFYAPMKWGKPLLKGFDPSQAFRPWLHVVARNFWIAEVGRRRQPYPTAEWDEHAGPDTVERDVLARELDSRLTAALAELPYEHQSVMALKLAGRAAEQIASELRLPILRVYRVLHRARQLLAQRLDVDLPPSNSGRKPRQTGPEPRS
jgi:RNA polymerase sigma factor (sigma-70 family)